MPSIAMKKWLVVPLLLALAGAGLLAWRLWGGPAKPPAFASGNGRAEATEVNISTKLAGRIISVLAREGDDVAEGQVLARMDTSVLRAELREAEAAIAQARQKLASAQASVAQRANETAAASALVAQRSSQLTFSTKELGRSKELLAGGYIAEQKLDSDVNAAKSDAAQVRSAQAQHQAAKAAEDAAKAGVSEAQAAIEAATAKAESIRADIRDSTLVAPIGGRVLYRLAEPGEVLAAGGRVLTLLDLNDVYMTVFLPTELAGRVALDAEARIVLDMRPDLSIPAKVSFVSPQAQFTPKAVETRTEREKLMFRIKVKVDPELLRQYAKQVKTGLPGVAHIRLDAQAPWPKDVPPVLGVKKTGP